MNGAANGGRLNGVRLGVASDDGVDGFVCTSLSSAASAAASPSSDLFSFAGGDGGAWRKRINLGSTDTISPGASLVFAFWCCILKR